MCGALNENIKGLGVNGLPQADIQAEPVNPVIRLATLASDDMAAVEAVIEERMASATRSISSPSPLARLRAAPFVSGIRAMTC